MVHRTICSSMVHRTICSSKYAGWVIFLVIPIAGKKDLILLAFVTCIFFESCYIVYRSNISFEFWIGLIELLALKDWLTRSCYEFNGQLCLGNSYLENFMFHSTNMIRAWEKWIYSHRHSVFHFISW